MASHTFVRLGRYHDGVIANVRAFEADMGDSEHCRRPYLPEHNLEMLIYAATSGGEVLAASFLALTFTHFACLCFTTSVGCMTVSLITNVSMPRSLSEPLQIVFCAVTFWESNRLPSRKM